MSELELKKQALKFDHVVIKNLESKTHLLLTNPEINAEVEKLNNKLENLFTYKPKKPVEEMSNREFRKYKRAKKRHENGVPKNIDFKKLMWFAIIFFSIAIVGAVISWIYLATVKIKPSEILNNQVEIFSYQQTENSGTGVPEIVDLQTFSKNKVSNEDIKPYQSIKFSFLEKAEAVDIKNIYFKLKTKGRGTISIDINFYDTRVKADEPVYTALPLYFDFENNKVQNFKVNSNYSFGSTDENCYIEIVVSHLSLASEIENYGFALYDLLFNKA